jgi:hypothetical protein
MEKPKRVYKSKQWWQGAETRAQPMQVEQVFKIPVLRIGEFIKEYHPNVAVNTVKYWIYTGKIDFTKMGRESVVVLTPKTLAHK